MTTEFQEAEVVPGRDASYCPQKGLDRNKLAGKIVRSKLLEVQGALGPGTGDFFQSELTSYGPYLEGPCLGVRKKLFDKDRDGS